MDRFNYREIFDGIRREDSRVLHMVYHDCFPSVRHFIRQNHGTDYDAQDVFQDAMVVVFLKVKNTPPELTSTFSTYLFSIAKYLWYKELRRRNRTDPRIIDPDKLIDYEQNFLRDYIRMEKRKLVMEHYYEMGESCRKLLSLFIQNTPVERITKIMGSLKCRLYIDSPSITAPYTGNPYTGRSFRSLIPA